MSSLALRKEGAFVPYERWTLKINAADHVEYLEIYDSELAAKYGCCKWYLHETGEVYDFNSIVTDLGSIGFTVEISQV